MESVATTNTQFISIMQHRMVSLLRNICQQYSITALKEGKKLNFIKVKRTLSYMNYTDFFVFFCVINVKITNQFYESSHNLTVKFDPATHIKECSISELDFKNRHVLKT